MTTTTFGWKRFGAARAATLWAGVACALTLEGTALALPDGMTDSELMSTLKTGQTGAREEACDRLGDRRATSARAEIAKAAEADESARVRQSCVEALGELGGAESAAVLRRIAMADKNDEVREEALEALEDVGTEADDAETVARVLESDRSTRVRKEAAEFLGERRWKAGIAALSKVARDERAPLELRKECVEALFKMDDAGAQEVVYEILLKSDSTALRREAADAIEERPLASALKPLCQALNDRDDDVVEDAIEGLLRLGDKSAANCLREAAQKRGGRLGQRMEDAARRL